MEQRNQYMEPTLLNILYPYLDLPGSWIVKERLQVYVLFNQKV